MFLLLLLVIEFVCFVSSPIATRREHGARAPVIFEIIRPRNVFSSAEIVPGTAAAVSISPLFNSLMSLAKLTVGGGQTTFTGSPTQDSSHKVLKEPKAKKKTGGKKEPKREIEGQLRILVARSYSAVEFLWL